MSNNYRLSEAIAVVATVDPEASSVGAASSDYIDMQDFESIIAIVSLGIMVSSGTLDFKLQQATSSTGAGVKDITSASITQMTSADNDEQAIVGLRATALDVANDFQFVKGVLTFGTAGGDSSVVILAGNPKVGPASDNDLASVGEIVNVQ